ncbi:hypothetical protein DXV24_07600 [Escherichia albertii]|nr:hypothetical protein [Escherichia albertii]
MRRLSRLIRPTVSQRIEIAGFVGRIRRSRRIRHSVLNARCDAYRVLSGLRFHNVLKSLGL